MKKVFLLVVAMALALVFAGCSCSASTSSSAASSSSASSSASASSASSSSSSAASDDVVVPDLKGKTQNDAEKALSDVGLVGAASNPEESTEVAPGQVFKQSTAPGTVVKKGDVVVFTVALAPDEATVPDVVGKTRDEAKKDIVNAQLGFDYTAVYDDKVAEGKVISQSVAAGTKVKTGTTVSVAVSLGPKPVENVQVPDVLTYSRAEAESAMQSAGLVAGFTGDADGSVVAQDVAAGTKVAPGTKVTMTLKSPEPKPDPGQNPVMNFIGPYGCDRASAKVDAVGDKGARITVTWSNSADETDEWTMEGTFDTDNLTVKYTNGKKVSHVYDSSGKETAKTVYSDGTGTITFKDGSPLSFTWKDDKEDVAKGMTFVFGA